MTMTSEAKRVFIPGDMLLPNPAILGKLAALDKEAAPWIMNRMQERQQQAFAADHASLKASFMSTVRSPAFWRGFLSAFAFFPVVSARGFSGLQQRMKQDAVLNTNHAWAATGNHLRAAITDYMRETGVPKAILTEQEAESLKPLKLTL